jgi:hypothetical protein
LSPSAQAWAEADQAVLREENRMSSVWQDLRFGARYLLRHPSVTTLALLTLSLCIGANTAIFSVINGVLLEPLPFPRPEQLTVVIESAPKLGFPEMGGSPPNFNDWRSRNQVFSSLAAFRRRRFNCRPGERLRLAAAAGQRLTISACSGASSRG